MNANILWSKINLKQRSNSTLQMKTTGKIWLKKMLCSTLSNHSLTKNLNLPFCKNLSTG